MPASSQGGKRNFYAVAVGRQRGVFTTWEECELQVKGFSSARFKSFRTREEAQEFVDHAGPASGMASGPSDSARPTATTAADTVRKNHVPLDVAAAQVGTKRARSPLAVMFNESSSGLRTPNWKDDKDCVELLQLLQQWKLSAQWMSAREQEAVEVYVDGACRANGKGELARGGYGGFYAANDLRNFSLPLPADEPQTNNRAELYAVIHALCTAQNAERCHNLRVYSDSRYTIMGCNVYLQKWLRNGFTGSSGSKVANSDLWKRLSEEKSRHATLYAKRLAAEFRIPHVLALRVASHLALQLIHVRGHAGVPGNVMADRLAVMGSMTQSRR